MAILTGLKIDLNKAKPQGLYEPGPRATNFDAIKSAALAMCPSLLEFWLPGGKVRKKRYNCHDIDGGTGDNFSVCLDSGQWIDYRDPDLHGSDLISLYAELHGMKNGLEAAKGLAREIGLDPGKITRLTPEMASQHKAELEAKKQAAAEQQRAQWASTATQAQTQWGSLPPAKAENAYLQAKGITQWFPDFKEYNGVLVAPMFATWEDYQNKRPCNLQSIKCTAQGTEKRYLPGAQKGGAFLPLEEQSDGNGPVWISEGIATAASVADGIRGTGLAGLVVAAMDAGNLEPVALALRTQFPSRPILFAADNDCQWKHDVKDNKGNVIHKAGDSRPLVAGGSGNVGLVKASAAAQALGGKIAYPEMDGSACDFNDLFKAKGMAAVLEFLTRQIEPFPEVKQAIEIADQTEKRPPEWEESESIAPPAFNVLEDAAAYAPGTGFYEGPAPSYNWLFKGTFEQGAEGIFNGPPGVGKSTALTQAVFAVGTGTPWLGTWEVPNGPQRAAFLSCEDRLAELHRRSEYIRRGLTAEQKELAKENVRLMPLMGMTTLAREGSKKGRVSYYKANKEALLRFLDAFQPKFIVLDTLRRLWPLNEVDNALLTTVLSDMAYLAAERDLSILITHHNSKTKAATTIVKNHDGLKEILEPSSAAGGAAITGTVRLQITSGALSQWFANTQIEGGESLRFDGEVIAIKAAKKNVGAPEHEYLFRHDREQSGLLVPCKRKQKDDNSDVKAAQKAAAAQAELEEDTQAVVKLAVEIERGDRTRLSPSHCAEGLGKNKSRSESITNRALLLGLLEVKDGKELKAANNWRNGAQRGNVLVPTQAALDRYPVKMAPGTLPVPPDEQSSDD